MPKHAAARLPPGGRGRGLMGSPKGPPGAGGPPRRSARDITAAVEPVLELLELRDARFESEIRSWICLSRRRDVPAQPSTLRS